ncbi:MAG: nuclear transport factor 2 family protein, partial [Pontixanthobacter sp.]
LYEDGTPKTRHLTTNPIIELAPDQQSATCRSQWTVLQALDDLPLQVIGSGRYHDELKLVSGEWAFARREYLKVDFWGDASKHLKHAPASKVH